MDFFYHRPKQGMERPIEFVTALGLSLFLVYVIMASQFESPFNLSSHVHHTDGVRRDGTRPEVARYQRLRGRLPWNDHAAGIVVNNAIVLVDYTNTLRSRGLLLKEAIVRRPCPLAPDFDDDRHNRSWPAADGAFYDGAEFARPWPSPTCGLPTSTVLTLLVIPTIYYLFRSANAISRLWA